MVATATPTHPHELQVCNKIVDSDRGVAHSYKGNYTDFLRQKDEANAAQWAAFEKWSKEVAKQKDIVRR